MPRLQQVKRSNGSLLHSINLPLEAILEAGWQKGDELIVNALDSDLGIKFIIYRAEDSRRER